MGSGITGSRQDWSSVFVPIDDRLRLPVCLAVQGDGFIPGHRHVQRMLQDDGRLVSKCLRLKCCQAGQIQPEEVMIHYLFFFLVQKHYFLDFVSITGFTPGSAVTIFLRLKEEEPQHCKLFLSLAF